VASSKRNQPWRILVIDTDRQAHATLMLTGNADYGNKSLSGLIESERYDEAEILSRIVKSRWSENIHLLPADRSLAKTDEQLVLLPRNEYRLSEPVDAIKDSYDWILIDTSPTWTGLSVCALMAAEEVLIPLDLRYLALQGLIKMVDDLLDLQKTYRHDRLSILGVLVTKFDRRLRGMDESLNDLRESQVGPLLFDTIIPENVDIDYAQRKHMDIFTYNPKAAAAIAYAQALVEVFERYKG
jgi:chromosome partitioning protein